MELTPIQIDEKINHYKVLSKTEQVDLSRIRSELEAEGIIEK